MILCGLLIGLTIRVNADTAVSAKSTWQLCMESKSDSSVSISIRDDATQELGRRGANCKFLDPSKKVPDPVLHAPAKENSTDQFLKQNQDLLIRSQPRF